jgi:hypothetical protein
MREIKNALLMQSLFIINHSDIVNIQMSFTLTALQLLTCIFFSSQVFEDPTAAAAAAIVAAAITAAAAAENNKRMKTRRRLTNCRSLLAHGHSETTDLRNLPFYFFSIS